MPVSRIQTPDGANTDLAQSRSNGSNAQDAVANTPLLNAQEAAPADYYQANFVEVFEYVLTAYENVLPAKLAQSLKSYLQADDDAQRLFARLLTRKGPVFLEPSLSYAEINDTPSALENLATYGLIARNPALPADRLLHTLKKSALLDYFVAAASCPKNWAKERVSEHILTVHTDARIRQIVSRHTVWFSLSSQSHWRLVQLLYFGQANKDWSAHIRRDLGHMRYESVELSQSRFATSKSLQNYLRERTLRSHIFRLDEHPSLLPGLVRALAEPVTDAEANRLRQRNLLRLGKWCEQHQALDEALSVYRQAEIPPARERRVRIHDRRGENEAAQQLLMQIAQAPLSATEQIFSERFGQRGAGYQPPTTVWSMEQGCDFETPTVENFVLNTLLEEHGGWGVHSENALLKSLTGLIYWQAIFAPVPGAFTNPFQSAPHDLMAHEFASTRFAQLRHIETCVAHDQALVELMQNTASEKWGTANPLVSWGLLQSVSLDDWLEAVPIGWVRQLSAFLIRNLNDYRKGFPDLFLCYDDHRAEFVEVKGPTDQIQPQQRAWFRVFRDMGIEARVIKLKITK